MGISEKIRKLQDSARDSGWRIKHISFVEDGKFQTYHTTPLSNFLTLSGFVLFGLSVYCLIKTKVLITFISGFGPVLTPEQAILVGIGAFVLSLLIIMSGATIANYMRCLGWKTVYAECLDKEIKDYYDPDSNRQAWVFRVLCQFSFGEQSYKVTPEVSALMKFTSEGKIEQFLQKNADGASRLKLLVNPENPLETIIGTKPVKIYFIGIGMFMVFGIVILSFAWFLMKQPGTKIYCS